MKLVYIANSRMPTERAYGIQITKMCEAFADQGIETELLAPFRNNLINKNLFKYHEVRPNFKFSLLSAPDFYFWRALNHMAVFIKSVRSSIILCSAALKGNPDVIYSRDELPILLLIFIFRVESAKLIFEAHKFSKWRRPIYWLFGKTGLKFVVISNGLKKEFIKSGVRADKMIYAPDGIDFNEFNINITKEEARRRLDLPADKKIAMYTGHLFDWKGAYVLAEAAYYLPEVWFLFVGGTEADILKFKEKYGRNGNVKILGQKPHLEIPIFLKAADILILPNSAKESISRLYTSPLKLFEYMAAKRPIITSDLPSLREVLNSQNSVLVKPDDPSALSMGISLILENKVLAEWLAHNAFEAVRDYTWQQRAARIFDFISGTARA